MDFKKKLIIRLIIALGFITFGIELIFVNLNGMASNEVISVFGAVFIVMGIVRAIQNFVVIKNDKAFEKRKVEENDERNIMIMTKARSLAVGIYMILSAAAVILLYLAGKEFIAQIIAYTICAFVLIDVACRLVLRIRY